MSEGGFVVVRLCLSERVPVGAVPEFTRVRVCACPSVRTPECIRVCVCACLNVCLHKYARA